ncbi:MAG TPA: sensor histidine kinase [Gemmatimonadales bacterium]|nr:sensor histidine kinase [Gemmatimonadales bacterium]
MTQTTKESPPVRNVAGIAFQAIVVVPAVVLLAMHLSRHPELWGRHNLLFWCVVVAVVELLPVPVSRVLQLSLSFPILLGVAILFDPFTAGAVAFIGAFDSREFRREIPAITAFFNRTQIALSVIAGSAVFHSLATVRSSVTILLPAVLLAAVADYCVNVFLVTLFVRFVRQQALRVVLSNMRLGGLRDFLMNYLGLAFIGVVIARLYDTVGLWSVAAFVLPLIFARQMFFRTMALEDAHKELQDRERVLRDLSNRMAEERQDERMQIAAYLHDDLAQMLFRLTLQVEMAKKRLAQGEVSTVVNDLDGIAATKEQTSDAIRALIRDLHRSPIGRKGLAEAIQSFAEDMSKGIATQIHSDVVEVSLPPPIQLLIYQIAREAAYNALKHAEAENIWITLQEIEDGVQLQIRDDGKGFDTSAPPPEGHFGSVMMRERAQVARGKLSVESEMGHGTTVTASFPKVWVEEGTRFEAAEQPPDGDGQVPADELPTRQIRRLRRGVRKRPHQAAPPREPASEPETAPIG